MTDEKITRLEDLDVKEVSHVDRGANKRTYLVVKNHQETTMANPTPESADKATDPNPAPVQDAPVVDPVVEAQAEKANEATDLITSLPDTVREPMAKMLADISARIGVLGEAVKAAPAGEGLVSDKFKNEVSSLSAALRQIVGADKAADIEAIDKNFLSQQSPVAMGYGEMVAMAAAPEIVQTADGPMMKMPMAMMKTMACKYAVDLMYEAQDAMYDTNVSMACTKMAACLKALGPFIGDDEMPVQMAHAIKTLNMSDEAVKQYAYNQPQPSITAGVPHSNLPPNPESGQLAKAGRKISGTRLDKLTAVLDQLASVVDELRPRADEPAEQPAVMAKSEIPPELVAKVAQLINVNKSQAAELRQLKATRPLGNATTHQPEPSAPQELTWPDDLTSLLDDENSDQ